METYEYKEEGDIGGKSWEASIAMMRAQKSKENIWDEDTMWDFSEKRDNAVSKFATEFLNGNKFVSWSRVPAARLKRIWLDFGKTGFVRDAKGMEEIADLVMKNIAALDAGNALSGHSQESPEEMLECAGYDFDEEQMEKFIDYMALEDGTWLVSDYGLPYLLPIYQQIYKAKTPEEQLYAVDRALNVVHQRNDLAAYFVEGGIQTLIAVFTQGSDIPKINK